jgi:hypothetical protein
MSKSDPAAVQPLLEKLELARNRKLSCFGSESHNFRLRAPLSQAELTRFEAEHGITLPSAYRLFLGQAGNGGAGPYYGIYPLERWKHFAEWVFDDPPVDILTRASSLRVGENPSLVTASDAELLSAYQGALSVGSQGCGYQMLLIVSGPCRGRVAYVDADGQPPYVVPDDDFLSWYERWLDEALAGRAKAWFGRQ